MREPADNPYRQRQHNVQDLAEHDWTLTPSIADVHPGNRGGETGQL